MYDLLLQGKISVVRTCDGKVIKLIDCIIKVAITRGNITWRSFALRDCAYKTKKRMATSASLYEGPIFYFSLFTFMQESIVCILISTSIISRLQASCGGERSWHIWLVKYIWSWIIIVDITLEVKGWEATL